MPVLVDTLVLKSHMTLLPKEKPRLGCTKTGISNTPDAFESRGGLRSMSQAKISLARSKIMKPIFFHGITIIRHTSQ
jgi:hypothetical protein